MFICSLCEKVFGNRSKFMPTGKKSMYRQLLIAIMPALENVFLERKTVGFNTVRGINEKTNGSLYNDEIIRQTIDMMESFTHRIVDMERKTSDMN